MLVLLALMACNGSQVLVPDETEDDTGEAQSTCSLEAPPAEEVDYDDTVGVEVRHTVEDPWTTEVILELRDQEVARPLVGMLTERALVMQVGAAVRAVSASTGAELWEWGPVDTCSRVALADLDGDGAHEVLAFSDHQALALSSTGELL